MDSVISFFRDTLDGPFYIVWVVILVILIFACIGYLAEKGINKKNEKEKYATVNNNDSDSGVIQDAGVSEISVNEESQSSMPVNDATSVDINSSTSLNEQTVIPDVVATPVQPVTNVVNDIPVQEVNNVTIPSVNQDGNNTI